MNNFNIKTILNEITDTRQVELWIQDTCKPGVSVKDLLSAISSGSIDMVTNLLSIPTRISNNLIGFDFGTESVKILEDVILDIKENDPSMLEQIANNDYIVEVNIKVPHAQRVTPFPYTIKELPIVVDGKILTNIPTVLIRPISGKVPYATQVALIPTIGTSLGN